MPPSSSPGTLSAARTVVAFGLVFQLAGLGKMLIIAQYFGAGPILDAYYLGLVIPTFLAGLAMALLQIGFVPTYVEAKTRKDERAAERIRSDALIHTVTLLGIAGAIIYVAEGPVVSLLWPGMGPTTHDFLWVSYALLIWTTPITGFIDGAALLLNAEGRFAAAAAAPLANLIVSSAFIVLSAEKSLRVLIWSLFAGLAAQVIILVITLRRAGIRLNPRISFSLGIGRSFLSIGLPVLIASVFANSIPAFIQVMAARSGPGAVSVYGYASRFERSLLQAIVMSVSLVLLPHFARLLAENKQQELRENLTRVFAAATLFYFAVLAFIVTGGQEAVDLLLRRGRFTVAEGKLVWEVWLALAAGLLGATWGIFLARLFQAKKRPWVIVASGVVSVVTNVALSLLLMPRFGIAGIALANSLAYLAVTAMFHFLASKSLGNFVNGATIRFVALAAAVNTVGGLCSMLWANLLTGEPKSFVLVGQVAIIAGANMLLARCPPLRLSPLKLFRT